MSHFEIAEWLAEESRRCTPDVVAPSGRYGFQVVDPIVPLPAPRPVVAVVQLITEGTGDYWAGTPAHYYAEDLAARPPAVALAIDYGAGWSLSVTDTAALVEYARGLL